MSRLLTIVTAHTQMLRPNLYAARDWLLKNAIQIEPVCAIIIAYANDKWVRRELKCLSDEVVALVELPNGWLASASGKDIHLWDVSTGQMMRAWAGHAAKITALGVFADGTLISFSKDVIIVWNTWTCQAIGRILSSMHVRAIATISSTTELACATDRDNSVRIITLAGETRLMLNAHKKMIRALVLVKQSKRKRHVHSQRRFLQLFSLLRFNIANVHISVASNVRNSFIVKAYQRHHTSNVCLHDQSL